MSLFDNTPLRRGAYGQLVADDPPPVAKPIPKPIMLGTDKLDREAERVKRDGQKREILALLRQGPQLSSDLIKIAPRVSGRIFDLRKDGHEIVTECIRSGVWTYTLHEVNASEASRQP